MKEYDYEPVPGLPAQLPNNEKLLWQGAPSWKALARRVFHVRALTIYFAALIVWREVTLLTGGSSALEALRAGLPLLGLGLAAIAILGVLAWLFARGTVYTITSRRVVIRFGVAFPGAINLPFRVVDGAALRTFSDGTGDIPLTLADGNRVSWFAMWPHVRPARFAKPQPMLRGVYEPERVAQILARALTAHTLQSPPVRVRMPKPQHELSDTVPA